MVRCIINEDHCIFSPVFVNTAKLSTKLSHKENKCLSISLPLIDSIEEFTPATNPRNDIDWT